MTDVEGNCRRIFQQMKDAAARSGRAPESVQLVAVTKTVSVENIRRAIACGITHIGENKLQEALPKQEALEPPVPITWHFIGHLQTNKAKKVVEHFDWVHSVDRLELAQALARSLRGKRLPVLIEVKLDETETKSGVPVAELPSLVAAVRSYETLELKGLMTIPPPSDDPELVRPHFRRLRELGETFELPELSMGMTHDFEIAIEEGATMIRVGTGIFGERS